MNFIDDLLEGFMDEPSVSLENANVIVEDREESLSSQTVVNKGCLRVEVNNSIHLINKLMHLNGIRDEIFTSGTLYINKVKSINSSMESMDIELRLDSIRVTQNPSKTYTQESINILEKGIDEIKSQLITSVIHTASELSDTIESYNSNYNSVMSNIVEAIVKYKVANETFLSGYQDKLYIVNIGSNNNIDLKKTPIKDIAVVDPKLVDFENYATVVMPQFSVLNELFVKNKDLISYINRTIKEANAELRTVNDLTVTLNDLVDYFKLDNHESVVENILNKLMVDYIPIINSYREGALMEPLKFLELNKSIAECVDLITMVSVVQMTMIKLTNSVNTITSNLK